jgi:heme/copper-type cytochrome/quinol oxidase subunit 3
MIPMNNNNNNKDVIRQKNDVPFLISSEEEWEIVAHQQNLRLCIFCFYFLSRVCLFVCLFFLYVTVNKTKTVNF